jgi:uncharacterized protein (TIGR02246 family)
MLARSIGLTALSILLAAGCAQFRASPDDSERLGLDQRQAEFVAAVAARDADGTAALFAEDAVLHVANMAPIEGREAIRQFYGNMYDFLSASGATPESTVVSESGDMAYTIGRTSSEFHSPEGTRKFSGKYALVWRELGGDWMIVLYAISSN